MLLDLPNTSMPFRYQGETYRVTSDRLLQIFQPTINSGMGEVGGFWRTVGKIAKVAIPAAGVYYGYQNYKKTGNVLPEWMRGGKVSEQVTNKTKSILNSKTLNKTLNFAADYMQGKQQIKLAQLQAKQSAAHYNPNADLTYNGGSYGGSYDGDGYSPSSSGGNFSTPSFNDETMQPIESQTNTTFGFDNKTLLIGGAAILAVILLTKNNAHK